MGRATGGAPTWQVAGIGGGRGGGRMGGGGEAVRHPCGVPSSGVSGRGLVYSGGSAVCGEEGVHLLLSEAFLALLCCFSLFVASRVPTAQATATGEGAAVHFGWHQVPPPAPLPPPPPRLCVAAERVEPRRSIGGARPGNGEGRRSPAQPTYTWGRPKGEAPVAGRRPRFVVGGAAATASAAAEAASEVAAGAGRGGPVGNGGLPPAVPAAGGSPAAPAARECGFLRGGRERVTREHRPRAPHGRATTTARSAVAPPPPSCPSVPSCPRRRQEQAQ